MFEHEKLIVYRKAVEFVALAEDIARRIPPGSGDTADQLMRAAISIRTNIAEGAGHFAKKQKARYYGYAKASATECADLLQGLIDQQRPGRAQAPAGLALLNEIVAMLTTMIRRLQT
ncbi:MAG TPA: four helix bundle protein [Solirubrobacterales bacterium]|nr:four helix bundle protein [Solirubrobacterales bacterium]